MDIRREIIETADGSKTIHLPELKESYHSVHGAVQEAKHVFLKSGWDQLSTSKYKILEIGFGTGLNAALTLIRGIEEKKTVNYTGIEAYPVNIKEIENLGYGQLPCFQSVKEEYQQIHESNWNASVRINTQFTLFKKRVKLIDFHPTKNAYNLIYFDAFAPRVQPEMWTLEVFQKMYDSLSKNGILVTYCAKGEVRRNMLHSGFDVEKITGPPGKREMLRAIKM